MKKVSIIIIFLTVVLIVIQIIRLAFHKFSFDYLTIMILAIVILMEELGGVQKEI